MPEVRGQHSDDREGLGLFRPVAHVRVEAPANDVWVSGKAPLPEGVADHRHLRAAGQKGVGVEAAADRRPDAQALDEARRHPRTAGRLSMVPSNQVEHVEVPSDREFDHIVQRTPLQEFETARLIRARRGVPDGIKAPGVRVGQRPHQLGVHYYEHCGEEGHSEAKGDNGDGGEGPVPEQSTEGDSEIRQEVVAHIRRTRTVRHC
jgi:hypothetical protein